MDAMDERLARWNRVWRMTEDSDEIVIEVENRSQKAGPPANVRGIQNTRTRRETNNCPASSLEKLGSKASIASERRFSVSNEGITRSLPADRRLTPVAWKHSSLVLEFQQLQQFHNLRCIKLAY